VSLKTYFPAGDVRELTRFQAKARDRVDTTGLDVGWHHEILPADPTVEAFDLWIRDGFGIQVHHHVSRDGVACVSWGLAHSLEVDVDWDRWSGSNPPPTPLGVLPNAMEAVAGEPGAWPYLCASVVARELDELGTTGAFQNWSKHHLCDGTPPPGTERADFWRIDPPSDLRPLVIEDNNGVTVRFFTRRDDPARLYLHEDRYARDDYDAARRDRLVGTAGGL